MRKKDRDADDDEAEVADDSQVADRDAPEYQFAGYNIEFSEKIVLTAPAAPQQKGAGKS